MLKLPDKLKTEVVSPPINQILVMMQRHVAEIKLLRDDLKVGFELEKYMPTIQRQTQELCKLRLSLQE